MHPDQNTYPDFFKTYINLVETSNISLALEDNKDLVINFFKAIPADKIDFAYASGKWTVKQILNHIIDTERVMSYRALRFARKDPQMNLSFDENAFAANADVTKISLEKLIEEFDHLRQANCLMFSNFSNETLQLQGQLSSGNISVLALGFTICSHALHHIEVINQKYL